MNLSHLSRQEASDLEQIAGAAVNVFLNRVHNARLRIRNGGSDQWIGQQEAELERALHLEAEARKLERAAHTLCRVRARQERRAA